MVLVARKTDVLVTLVTVMLTAPTVLVLMDSILQPEHSQNAQDVVNVMLKTETVNAMLVTKVKTAVELLALVTALVMVPALVTSKDLVTVTTGTLDLTVPPAFAQKEMIL